MLENKSSLFGIIAIIVGASGLGLGVFSVVNFQILEGPEGPQGVPGNDGQEGIDGTDGQDLVGLQVGILDPYHNEIVSGLVEIRILLWNSSTCSFEVFINGYLNASTIPWVWNTTTVSDGWYNVSVRVMDAESNIAQDEVMVYVLNNPSPTPIASVFRDSALIITDNAVIDFDQEVYDSTDSFNLGNDRYVVPEDGCYLVTASITIDTSSSNTVLLAIEWGYAFSVYCDTTAGSTASLSVTGITSLLKDYEVSVAVYINPEIVTIHRAYFSIFKLSD